MKKLLFLFTFFLALLFFSGLDVKAASCPVKNNQILWGSQAVTLDVKGKVTLIRSSEFFYSKNSSGKFTISKSSLKRGNTKLVYSTVTTGATVFYQIGPNSYLRKSSNLHYYSLPVSIKKCVEQKVYTDTINQIVKGANAKKSQFEKVLYVHDALANLVTYDWYEAKHMLSNINSHSALGAIVYKKAVCDGYAYAFSAILSKLHIESRVVTSMPMGHAWNLVKIDGYYYHVDVTWDDTDGKGTIYTYFLVSDKDLKMTRGNAFPHYSWDSGNIKATSEKYANISKIFSSNYFIYKDANYYYYLDTKNKLIEKTTLDGLNTTTAVKIDENIINNSEHWIILESTEVIDGENWEIYSKLRMDGKEKVELVRTKGVFHTMETANNVLTLNTFDGKSYTFNYS